MSHADQRGFTLLEVLCAVAILATAMSVILGTFTVCVRAWTRGEEALDDLHHGDYVMEQLVSALRSAAWFGTSPGKYGFHLEDRGGDYPQDMISWVTSGTAFLPQGSELAHGLHRLTVSIEDNEDGDDAVAIRSFPHLADLKDDESEPWFVSSVVKGLNCRIYNVEDEDWEDDWEDTNAIPQIVEITLYMDPLERYGDPITIKRMVQIPVAGAVEKRVLTTQPAGQPPDGAMPRTRKIVR
ncbi:MAG: type II secretion system protein [Kiritimatiellae bacterium]|nr:type II secretion system protein [Kiritimatiellia bacterium]